MRVVNTLLAMGLATLAAGCFGNSSPEAPEVVPPQPFTHGQGTPKSVQRWAAAMQPPHVVAFFDGLFERVGVRLTDTGEAFTCIHRGDHIEFSDELDPESVDFVVTIDQAQVDGMLGYLKAPDLDEAARFRIVSVIATPATAAMLKKPAIKSARLRSFLYWIGNAPAHMQVVLAAPAGLADMGHTIVRQGADTIVAPGLHGSVSEIYRLSVAEAVEFQRRMMAARKANSLWAWIGFARWYGAFTTRVAVPAGDYAEAALHAAGEPVQASRVGSR